MPSRMMNWTSLRAIIIIVIIAVASFLALFFASVNLPILFSFRSQEEATYFETSELLLREVVATTADLRGFPRPSDLKLEVHDRNWARENFGNRYVEAFSDEIAFQEAVFKAVFLISSNTSLAEIRVEQAGWTVASAYGDRVFVIQDFFNPEDRSSSAGTLAHEITHILQMRNLPTLDPQLFDEKHAWLALIEGDADLTSDELARIEGLSSRLRIPRASEAGLLDVSLDPLTQVFFFPYRFGPDFVEHAFESGGWPAVDELYQRPPTSTEQLLHDEKYLAKENPKPVAVELKLPSEWTLEGSDRMGEYFLLILLASKIQVESAVSAAAGWGGDNMTLFRNQDSTLVAWKIVWDTREDAIEFNDAFRIWLETMGGEHIAPDVWRVDTRYFLLRLHLEETLVVSSIQLRDLDPLRT
ncbi:MAG: hypothetical protein ACE5KO_04180 [Candidatus Bathyarchaeia archaeon]